MQGHGAAEVLAPSPSSEAHAAVFAAAPGQPMCEDDHGATLPTLQRGSALQSASGDDNTHGRGEQPAMALGPEQDVSASSCDFPEAEVD